MTESIVDARGLSCPQPVLLSLSLIKKQKTGELTVIVDSQVSKENVLRAAQSEGWNLSKAEESRTECRLFLKK
jgi:TusA-related sulfurtransferase